MNQKAEQLGIMGGTFNPIHHGHLIVARAAKEALGLDRLLLMPNARSPLRMQEALADAKDRLEMVRLAVAEEPGLEACDLEVSREGTSYLVDTLAELRSIYPASELTFLMGVDSLDTFDRWREVDRIVTLAKIVVLPRPGGKAACTLADLEKRATALQGKIQLREAGPHIDISATEIRERLRQGKSIRYLVPDAVAEYISSTHLFV
jgi:nicotinate-nucleotide adenylyltransferase